MAVDDDACVWLAAIGVGAGFGPEPAAKAEAGGSMLLGSVNPVLPDVGDCESLGLAEFPAIRLGVSEFSGGISKPATEGGAAAGVELLAGELLAITAFLLPS